MKNKDNGGELIDYLFGSGNDPCRITAKNLDVAKKIFKTQELFPEKYVRDNCVHSREYVGGERVETYVWNKGMEPIIDIELVGSRGGNYRYKRVGILYLRDCINIDYNDLLPKDDDLKLLTTRKEEESIGVDSLLVVKDKKSISLMNKMSMRKAQLELERKREEAEELIRLCRDSMKALKEELRQKTKLLVAFETYLGTHEDVYQIQEGSNSTDKEPLSVFQQVLYMDEEVGIWEEGGVDIRGLEDFDNWIVKNYKRFLYKPKSVIVFQVRRKDKKYSSDALTNCLMNMGNKNSYFLIRNGDNLYRIWANISIRDRLFPTITEYEDFIKEDNHFIFNEDDVKKKLTEKHQDYILGLIYIQGLIERTDILGTSMKTNVNLLNGEFTDEEVVLIRDAEQSKWIDEGRPSFRKYIEKNRSTIGLGTRIILTQKDWSEDGMTGRIEGKWRIEPFTAIFPENEEMYIIEEETKGKWDRGNFKIWYLPEDDVWDGYQYKKRTRRVPFRFYDDECINVDKVTLEDIEYYANNRNERHNYLNILPSLFYIKQVKLKEEKLEKDFRLLILGKMMWGIEREDKVSEAVIWWRLKNKWKRPITEDMTKAIRMIVNRLKSFG